MLQLFLLHLEIWTTVQQSTLYETGSELSHERRGYSSTELYGLHGGAGFELWTALYSIVKRPR